MGQETVTAAGRVRTYEDGGAVPILHATRSDLGMGERIAMVRPQRTRKRHTK